MLLSFLLYLCGCRRVSGHFLATGLRWILQRRASNSLFAPGGFLRNLRFRGVEVFALTEAKPNRIIHE